MLLNIDLCVVLLACSCSAMFHINAEGETGAAVQEKAVLGAAEETLFDFTSDSFTQVQSISYSTILKLKVHPSSVTRDGFRGF